MKSVNPYNNQEIKDYQNHSDEEVNKYVSRCASTFDEWKKTSFKSRYRLFRNLKENLLSRKKELSELMAKEMGKPIKEGILEIEKCAKTCDYYIDQAPKQLKPEEVKTEYSLSEIHHCPLGVVLAVMPWNYPFWQVFRFAIPNLMAGNVAMLKHASNVSGCALAIEMLFLESGFPQYSFKTILADKSVIENIIENDLVRAVTLTGSTNAGKAIAKTAGLNLKKTVLELGGSDPYLIFSDADLKQAAKKCAESRLLNGGQSCISAKRFIVVDDVYDKFLELFKVEMMKKTIGDPLSIETELGPMARVDLRDELHEQVSDSVESGAKCLIGGKIDTDKNGAFYPPTILTNVKKGMRAYSEEFFGPVAVVIKVSSIEEAIEIANDTPFGLGAGIFSKDLKKAKEIASKKINAGSCFINDYVKSDPRLPFGGVKESGYGRELSHYGIKEFMNVKTICIK